MRLPAAAVRQGGDRCPSPLNFLSCSFPHLSAATNIGDRKDSTDASASGSSATAR